ncbi:LysE family translocator [Acinetobacter puyangensis]|uniref:LysE family translocator n=1 Tax=Acinetobacter puyangensis TaxID=1096779 RepID=UPI003A4DB527
MSLNLLLAFWSVSILFVITPGVDWAYAISAGIRAKKVPAAVTGLLFGHFIATIIIAAGVGTVIAAHPMLLLTLTIIGACYLLWIGYNLFLHPAVITSDDHGSIQSRPTQSWFIKGFCVSALNPKVFLFFLALLPQFIDSSSSWPIVYQIVLLGLIHIFSCGVVYLIVGFSAQKLLSSRPRAAQIVSRISGALMVLIATILLIEQIKF